MLSANRCSAVTSLLEVCEHIFVVIQGKLRTLSMCDRLLQVTPSRCPTGAHVAAIRTHHVHSRIASLAPTTHARQNIHTTSELCHLISLSVADAQLWRISYTWMCCLMWPIIWPGRLFYLQFWPDILWTSNFYFSHPYFYHLQRWRCESMDQYRARTVIPISNFPLVFISRWIGDGLRQAKKNKTAPMWGMIHFPPKILAQHSET